MAPRGSMDDVARDHGLALALRGRCPLCAEVSGSPGILTQKACSSCEGLPVGESPPEAVLDAYRGHSLDRVWLAVALTGASSLLVGLALPVLSLLVLGAALVLFRMTVVQPALLLMGRGRRIVSRWALRFGVAAAFTAVTGVLAFASTIPVAGGLVAAVTSPLALTIVWLLGRRYLLRQLERERQGAAVAGVEIAIVVLSGALLVSLAACTMLGVVMAVEAMQRALDALLGFLGPDGGTP